MKIHAVRGRLLPLYAVLLAAASSAHAQESGAGETKAGAPAAELEADVESLGKAAEHFVEAYNRKDAAGIAALFAENGEIIARDGDTIHGRDAIKERYEELFAGDKVPQIALEASSVRMVAPGVAIEDGVIHFTTDGRETVESVSYSATQVKQGDGSWLIASTRDQMEVTPPSEHLKALAWLEGEWSYEGEEGVRMDLVLEMDGSGNFLLGEAISTDTAGEEQSTSIRIGWNPACSSVFWWTFDSDGGNASGQWTRRGDTWLIRTGGITADAETTAAMHTLSRDGDDTILWNATDRVMAGEPQPDAALRFVRRAPEPEAEPVAAPPEDNTAEESPQEASPAGK